MDGLPDGDERVALEEISLYADVIIAVTSHEGPLSPAEIDALLGLPSQPAHAPARRSSTSRA